LICYGEVVLEYCILPFFETQSAVTYDQDKFKSMETNQLRFQRWDEIVIVYFIIVNVDV